MAVTDNQKMFAMYVIGTVESNCNWASVNYNDPITIGMMQWYGTRAAGLLNDLKEQAPANYGKIASSLQNDISAHDKSASWWTKRYLTKEEGQSWASAAAEAENHKIQQSLFISDFDGYVETFTSWGTEESNIKSLIFIAVMYHQGPKYCGQVVAAQGANASLKNLYTGALNNRVLGVYKNRYTTAYNLLNDWDGASAPPDFGQVTDTTTNDGGDITGDTATQQASGIQCVKLIGSESLTVVGTDGTETLCYKTNGNVWYPRTRSTEAKNPGSGGGDDSGTTGDDDISKMQQVFIDNEGKFSYGQGAGRLTPETSGHTDCSGSIWWAINKIRPDLAANIGNWTGAMVNSGTEIARGTGTDSIDLSIAKKGDILLCRAGQYGVNWAFNDGHNHVEWYFGDNILWGTRATPCPTKNAKSLTDYVKGKGCWMLRRIL
jgi:hypothetical protein